MAKLGINTGSNADDGTGDSLRVGGGKINANFDEVYSLLTGASNSGTTLLSGIVTSITAGSNITLSGGPTGQIAISAAALTGTGFFTNNSTGIHTLGSVGIGTTTAENNGLSVPLGNVFVGKGVTTLNLNVAGVTTFSGGDISIKGDGTVDTTGVFWDASVATLEFDDLAKIAFGEGSDLTLYHDENDSWIKDQATGNLLIDSNGAAVKITKAGAAETMAEFNTDGPVKLFHNNVRVLETVSTGATVVGDLYVGGDLFVLDDVTYNEMNSVNLNVSGVSTFSGTSNLDGDLRVGVSTLFADVRTGRVGVGSDVPGDLFFVDGTLTATGLSTFSGGMTVGDTFTAGVSTFSDHVGLTSTVYLSDTAEFRIGANNDAILSSDGSKMKYYHATGTVVAFESNFGIDIGGLGTKAFSYRVASTAAEMYHNNSLKITTDKHGAIITGVATATGFSGPLTGDVTGDLTGNADTATSATSSTTATTATNVTVNGNNSQKETVYPVFVDGATGTQGIESDTGLTYNPTTGELTSTTFTGSLTGNVTGNASGSSGSCTGNSVTATDLAINATNRLVIQTGNNATDILAAGTSGQLLKSAGSGSAPTWSSDYPTVAKAMGIAAVLGNINRLAADNLRQTV